MKKLIFLVLFFPLFSCNDWLDVESEVSVTYRNYFQSEQDIEDIFITILGNEKKIFAPLSQEPFDWTGMYCDDVADGVKGFRNLEWSAYSSSLGNYTNWGGFYSIIYLANMLEENRHRFQNVSEERINYWIAQANFFKGLMYFELARRWGEAPIAPATEDASAQAKSPVDTVLAYALRAAEAALVLPKYDQLTDASGAAVTSRQFASIGSVRTLLANIYAWMGGLHGDNKYWEKAEEQASLVIDGKAGAYSLVSMKDLVTKTLGKARDVTEVIHTIEMNGQDDDRYYQGSFWNSYPGFALFNYPYTTTDFEKIENAVKETRISVAKVQELYNDENDLRIKEYWLNLGEPIPVTQMNSEQKLDTIRWFYPNFAYLNKWREAIYSVNPDVNLGDRPLIGMEGNRVYWRLADLILLRAECRAHLDNADAVKDLNRIRERAGLMGYVGSTVKEDLLREIFNERDRELFGETCRYYDVVRFGYYRELLEGNFKTLTESDVKEGALYYPVSQNAFNKNTLMKQNTYWSWHLQD